MALTKIAAAQINQYLLMAADELDAKDREIAELKEKLAAADRAGYAEKIASDAAERGIIAEETISHYARQLTESGRDLGAVEELVRHSSPNSPFGEPLEKAASHGGYLHGDSPEARFEERITF